MVCSKENEEMLWQVYLLRCADKTLYCGITTDIARRIAKHNAGKGAKYTRSRLPVTLMAASSGLSKSDALILERCIKREPAGKKIAMLQSRS
jgi:putative endonuclease